MRTIARRVSALETDMLPQGGWDWRKPTHLIGMDEGESYVDAVRKYRQRYPDKPVKADHNAIWLCFVEPKFNEDGSRIFRNPDKDYEDAKRDARLLGSVLAEMGEVE